MTIFKLGWATFDGGENWLLSHGRKSKRAFQQDVREAMQELGDAYLAQEKGWPSTPSWIEFAIPALLKRGYKLVTPVSYYPGGGDIIGFEHKGYGIDETDMQLRDLVGERLFDAAVKLNDKVNDSMHARWKWRPHD